MKEQLVNYPPTAEPMSWASGVITPTSVGSYPRTKIWVREFLFKKTRK
jgi:hypothetical protein